MHSFTSKSLFISILSLLGVGNTLAAQDAFGVTKYGFRCSDRIYKKFEIYAAAKRLCDARISRPDLRHEQFEVNGHSTAWARAISGTIDVAAREQYSLMPILADGSIYPIDLPPASRVYINDAREEVKIHAGPDRLLLDKDCNVLLALTEFTDSEGVDVEACQLLETPYDPPFSMRDFRQPRQGSPSHSRSNSPPRSPQRSHNGSPPRSRDGSPNRSSRDFQNEIAHESPHGSPHRSPQRVHDESPQKSSRESPERLPENQVSESPKFDTNRRSLHGERHDIF